MFRSFCFPAPKRLLNYLVFKYFDLVYQIRVVCIPRVDMSLHSDTLSLFRTNYSLFLPLNSVCLTRKQQISMLLSLVSSDRDSNSRATELEASSLTIIPPLQFIYFFIEKLPLCARNDTFGCLSQIRQKQHF
jgi:hypothetical protein